MRDSHDALRGIAHAKAAEHARDLLLEVREVLAEIRHRAVADESVVPAQDAAHSLAAAGRNFRPRARRDNVK